VAACVVLVVAAATGYTPRAVRLGWPGAVPTCVIVPLARWGETQNGLFIGELAKRRGAKEGEPMWIDRIALAWYGEYLVDHPLKATGAGAAGLWYAPSAHQDPRIGFAFLRESGAQGRGMWEKLYWMWRMPPPGGSSSIDVYAGFGGQIELNEYAKEMRPSDAKETLLAIAVEDADRHGILTRLLEDRDPGVQSEAVRSLMSPSLKNELVVPLLLRTMKNVDESVRSIVVNTIVTRPGIWDYSEECRQKILEISRDWDDPNFEVLVTRLPVADRTALCCRFIDDPRAARRVVVLRLMAQSGRKAAGCHDAILRVLKENENESCRFYAAHAIGWICSGTAEDRDALTAAAARDPADRVRCAAVEASLVCNGVENREEIARAALKDAAPSVRAAAARCLGALAPHPERVVAEIKALEDDPSSEVRLAVRSAMGQIDQRINAAGAKQGER
jgi:hypothetical protein